MFFMQHRWHLKFCRLPNQKEKTPGMNASQRGLGEFRWCLHCGGSSRLECLSSVTLSIESDSSRGRLYFFFLLFLLSRHLTFIKVQTIITFVRKPHGPSWQAECALVWLDCQSHCRRGTVKESSAHQHTCTRLHAQADSRQSSTSAGKSGWRHRGTIRFEEWVSNLKVRTCSGTHSNLTHSCTLLPMASGSITWITDHEWPWRVGDDWAALDKKHKPLLNTEHHGGAECGSLHQHSFTASQLTQTRQSNAKEKYTPPPKKK